MKIEWSEICPMCLMVVAVTHAGRYHSHGYITVTDIKTGKGKQINSCEMSHQKMFDNSDDQE